MERTLFLGRTSFGRTLLEGRTIWGKNFFEGEHFGENTFFLLKKLRFDEGITRVPTVPLTPRFWGRNGDFVGGNASMDKKHSKMSLLLTISFTFSFKKNKYLKKH